MAKSKKTEKTSKVPPGHKHVWLVMTDEQHHDLRRAAAERNMPMSKFALEATVEKARKINGREK